MPISLSFSRSLKATAKFKATTAGGIQLAALCVGPMFPLLHVCLIIVHSYDICLQTGVFNHSLTMSFFISLLLQPFPYLGSAHRVFNLHVLRSCASSIFTCISFMSFVITSLHPSFGLPIVRCPPTSILSLLHLLQSFSPHVVTNPVSLLICSRLCLPPLP